ncbi:hypothetical protein EYZ11_006076 [Aspergillus tanneri]|uniref:Carbohydrate esterase n=1 Tax=Aspergillus tanneri TaxID=1220188 RepID=A0A4S3JGC6_9EURO|nr:hypothetical protein EYZ11_006076 [Aspergillus tanneri]
MMKVHILCVMSSILALVAARPWSPASTTYFFTFGNSYTQTDFNSDGEQPTPSSPMGNPPLGTGTTAGGINWVGYLTTTENASLILSYNLAIGGATIDNDLVSSSHGDLVSQVALFEKAYANKPDPAPWTAESAVFGFWIGINDSFNREDANTFIPKLIARLASLVQKVYDAGGRKFLFLNVPPTSRSPMFLNQGNDTVQRHAAYLAVYNRNLRSMVAGFEMNHTDVSVVYYDSWAFMTKVLDRPLDYGFPDATCINQDGSSCFWWNDYHPSSKYHRLQAEDMKSVLMRPGW